MSAVPRHVAIIMDGNGRWAKKRHLPRMAGHKKGVEAAKQVAYAALDLGIEVLTLYAFSTENWSRPDEEVSGLMGLLKIFIERDVAELAERGVRLQVIGNWRALAPDLVVLIEKALARTADNSASTMVIALNYGSQAEITAAVQALAEEVKRGAVLPEAITADHIAARLETAELPPLDLLIRTSGEVRLSNFLLWQTAYAEMIFTPTLWPDFGREGLEEAVQSFAARDRRYGGL